MKIKDNVIVKPFIFNRTELFQLLSYVNARDEGYDTGWYYGNKANFEKRHERIKKILKELLDIEE